MTVARQGGRQQWRKEAHQITDRASRYRANACPPPGAVICAFCGSTRNVEVGHISGDERDSSAENLIWNCRACNTRLGIAFKPAGIGRRTRQFNPPEAEGAKSLGQWLTAVMSMKGESDAMSLPVAVEMDQSHAPGSPLPVCRGDLAETAGSGDG
jgi:hypothetical protein